MTRPVTLEYEHHAPPNRYEWEMESERARWLRRRFLWFTGTLVVVAVVMMTASLLSLMDSRVSRSATAVEVVANLVKIVAAGCAWYYALKWTRNERRLFSIAFWLVVGLGVLAIFASRISAELGFSHQLQILEQEEGVRFSSGGLEIRTGDRPGRQPVTGVPEPLDFADAPAAAATGRRSAGFVSGIRQTVSLWTIWTAVFISHLLACLFLPWTVREATRPALILLAAAGFLVLGDLLLGRGSVWYVIGAVMLLPLTVLPGIGWSWWRYSRFRRNFRNVFESKQLRQLTYELTGARRIHESSLPPLVTTGPVRLSYIYEPMSQIGGDVLYVHPRPPEHSVEPEPNGDFCRPQRQTVVLLDV